MPRRARPAGSRRRWPRACVSRGTRDHTPPRSGVSTRAGRPGSPCAARPASDRRTPRTSAQRVRPHAEQQLPRRPGRCRRCRRSSAVAAGRSPRRLSSALARIVIRYTDSDSPGSRGCRASQNARMRVEPARDTSRRRGRASPRSARAAAAGRARRARGSDPAARRPIRVGDVAGGLLEVGHEPAPLEHLGQDVGRALARQVHAAELGHRVVAVLEEHPLVESLGARGAEGVGPAHRSRRRVETNSSRNSRRSDFGERE